MIKSNEEVLAQAQRLHIEAEHLLYQGGLLATIQRFGPAVVVGSVALRLMVRRDIDIYVQLADDLDIATFFAIGAAITQEFPVFKASYSNHFIRNFSGFTHGLYWGIQLGYQEQGWKLDLWGHGVHHFAEHVATSQQLQSALAAFDPLIVLRIKESLRAGDGYCDDITGHDIYTAVLNENVRTPDQFSDWWSRRR